MYLEKKYVVDIYFYLGNILEKDNKYYFLNTNEFKNDEYPILDIGQICVDYANLDLKKWVLILKEIEGDNFTDFLVNLVKKSEQEYGYVMAVLLCNQLINLTNEILNAKNFTDFYKERFNEIPQFYEKYIENYGELPDENSPIKDVLLSFVSYIGTYQNLYREFLREFLDGNTNTFSLINEIIPTSMELGYKIIPNLNAKEKTYYFQEIFKLSDLDTFMKYDVLKIIERSIPINKCDNCGKYFIPKNKSNEKYCDNIFKDNKTCKMISYNMKLEKDEVEKIYRKAYKTQNAKKQRNHHIWDIEDKFKNWVKKAKKEKKLCKDKKITIEEFKLWIKNNENWHRNT